MLVNFFQGLKDGGVPVTPRELLDLLAAMNKQLVFGSIDDFYNLSRAVMVKDEKYYDRFDRAFGLHFRDLEGVDDVIEALIPDDWLRSEFVKQLSEEDKAKIESLGGLEKLIDEFKKRLEEQEKRHEGGNKWVGTGGTSPFGNDGFHPEGIRVGGQGKNKKAVKVWDRRDFKNLDDSVEIGTGTLRSHFVDCESLHAPAQQTSSTSMIRSAPQRKMLGCSISRWSRAAQRCEGPPCSLT